MARPRRLRSALAALATAASCALGAAPAYAASPAITLDTGLTPSFSTSVANYVTPCGAGGSVNVTVPATAGYSVAIDGAGSSTAAQTKAVPLAAGQRFKIAVKKSGKTTTASIRCIPSDFPKFEVGGKLPASFPLFAFSNINPVVFHNVDPQPYAIVADRNGIPVWWRRAEDSLFNVMGAKGGYIGAGHADGPLKLYTPRGAIYKSMRPTIGQPDAHEAIPTSRGTFYLGATSERSHVDLTSLGGGLDGYTLDSDIQEVSATGKSLWTWHSVDHFATSDSVFPQVFIPLTNTTQTPSPRYDIAHLNSIEDDGKGGIIASFRNESAVYDIDKASGNIRWKLGGTTTEQSLTVVGDDAADRHVGGQHDARLNPDGTLSVFDNGWGSNHGARATRWRIDPVAKTATLVEQLADPEIGKSICCGSARRGSDGSWLIGYGAIRWIRAYDPSQKRIFWLHFTDGGFSYRATPIPTSQLKESTLIAGMDYMNKR